MALHAPTQGVQTHNRAIGTKKRWYHTLGPTEPKANSQRPASGWATYEVKPSIEDLPLPPCAAIGTAAAAGTAKPARRSATLLGCAVLRITQPGSRSCIQLVLRYP